MTLARAHTHSTSDPELMQRVAQGEIGALGELYDRYHEAVRRFVARATADASDVDDLVHATFLTAAQSASRYDGRPVCRGWLIGIAIRLLRRRRYALGRWLSVLSSLASARSASVDPGRDMDARSDLERCLRRITHAKRIALLMAEVEGLSCQEIAEILEIPIGTVWTRLHAARRELRELLDGSDR
jgi:RNA polymerase sigma-70 factor (ECF subfamily)